MLLAHQQIALLAANLHTGGRLPGGAQPSYFTKLSAAAWPPPADTSAGARTADQAAPTSAPSAAAATTSGMAAGGRQASAPAPASLTGTSTARHADGGFSYPPPAAPAPAQRRAAERAAAPDQLAAGASPDVLSPDVIQISSGSSDRAHTQPAAADRSPLEDSLTSGRSSRGKRQQPESCSGAERTADRRCAVRRRVVLDSDTEVSALMASLDARRESTARAGAGQRPAQLGSQEQHEGADVDLDLGGDGSSSEHVAAQRDPCTQSTHGGREAEAADQSPSNSTGSRHDAAHAEVAPVNGANAAVTAVRLAELIAAAASLPDTAPSPQRFHATDCSVIRMPVPLRFKDDTNRPLHR